MVNRRLRDAGNIRDIGKAQPPVVTKELQILLAEMRDRNRESPGVQIVSESHSHIRQGLAVFLQSYARLETHLGKAAISVVSVQIIVRAVIGDEKIGSAVVVEVRPNGRQAQQIRRARDARFLGNVAECAVAVIPIQVVGRSFQSGGPALNFNGVVLAGHHRAEGRQIVQIECGIVGHEQVLPAVAVIVSEGGARGPEGVGPQSRLLRDVGESAVAVVAIEHHAPETGHQKVRPSVVVVIPRCRAVRPTGVPDTRFFRYVAERAVVIVMK